MDYRILGRRVFVDGPKAIFSFSKNDFLKAKNATNFIFDNYHTSLENYDNPSITFCINLSDACNLNCDYCFNKNKTGTGISLDDAFNYLSLCFSTFPNKEKYFVDLSGKGEPLFFVNKILAIKEFCDKKSNLLKREVLVQFVCNGTMLTPNVAKILQKNGILFGISIDGNRRIHDKHRRTKTGNKTFRDILRNLKQIENKEYVGAACTLTKDVFSLKKSLINLSKTFNTVSYKPSRNCSNAITIVSINKWKHQYDELCKFLLKEVNHGYFKHVKTLLNGDDYFGKFIRRIILQQRVLLRCDAGFGRFALDSDKNIYICPASFGIKDLAVGTISGFEEQKRSSFFNQQLKKGGCLNCDFRFFCGGECQLEHFLSKGNNAIMCEYKKHLILLAMYFVDNLKYNTFKYIKQFCEEVDSRRHIDKNLIKYLENHPQLSFTVGKQFYDREHKRY